MGKFFIIIAILVLIVGGGAFFLFKKNIPKPDTVLVNSVDIKNMTFNPTTAVVRVGDKITFTNNDAMSHSATADDGSFDTGILESGQSKSITISKTGSFVYHCSIHPNMKGTIIVQ